jgi:N-ethylmaleimide reductase
MRFTTPIKLGSLHLRNRLVLAPLTRQRSGDDGVPTESVARYYSQRSSLGMLVTEGTFTSRQAQAFMGQPGIVTMEQIAGWRKVADAVHAEGGTIVMQVMHGGRVSHVDVTGTPDIVAPSAIPIGRTVRTPTGKQPHSTPRALRTDEIPAVIEEIVQASRNAIAAGLDGVEIHAANGYLINEFFAPNTNQRSDLYGGSPGNRARFAIEAVTAVAEAVGAGRTGVRISPQNDVEEIEENDPVDAMAVYGAFLDAIRPLGLAYLSILHDDIPGQFVQEVRARFGGHLVANNGDKLPTTRVDALTLLDAGHADAVAVGRKTIANPDLLRRWVNGLAENEPDVSTFYVGGDRGYVDYPLHP